MRIYSNNNYIYENTLINNLYGISLGISSNGNHIYHNNFLNNIYHASDYGTNSWDNGYITPYNPQIDGGNYWDDFEEKVGPKHDDFRGTTQLISGSDGIIDRGLPSGGLKPYPIGTNPDRYPFMSENGWLQP
jgi:parallel beta-helix repeat protein